MRLVWTPRALRNLDEIGTYIAESDPRAAQVLLNRIRGRAVTLADLPYQGRAGRLSGTREHPVSKTSYIVAYRVKATSVDCIAVYHTARRWPKRL